MSEFCGLWKHQNTTQHHSHMHQKCQILQNVNVGHYTEAACLQNVNVGHYTEAVCLQNVNVGHHTEAVCLQNVNG